MPTIVHSLDTQLFIQMSPAPPSRKQRLLIESRAGVDSFAFWQDAIRGQIYRPVTIRDTSTHALAQVLKNAYEGLVGGDPVPLVYADITYPDVIVKDVEVTISDQLIGIGGFNATVGALVRARWELVIT